MFPVYIKLRFVLLLVCGLILSVGQLEAATFEHSPFIEGKHYLRLPLKIIGQPVIQRLKDRDPNKIQVLEFFSYGCYGCYHLQPALEAWHKLASNQISFYRFPIVFQAQWQPLAKIYLALQLIKQEDRLNLPIFTAIHEKRRNILEEAELKRFLEEQSVPYSDFIAAYESIEVMRQLKIIQEVSVAYKIAVSPALVINGPKASYLITPVPGQTEEQIVALLKSLLEEETQALKAKTEKTKSQAS
jgi:thiol:disulfide interchange protein DsbA